ncbi:hemagglutinin repeat-containing protein [Yersinia sp. 2540 StPb PI]|uniref:hemagglutinin repeat-containing protein n=1 Tax=Yersinia sp. 2540 StPb PI TaxID=3117406 RepID=UPI003FA4A2B7
MKTKQFTLSSGGKLAVLISMILTPVSISYAAGIEAAGEKANRPEISHLDNGAVLINIAPPSESGLSHNQYQDFNVDKPGAVFNNSIQNTNYDKESIAANPNLTTGGRGAEVILNEVVGDNPSILLGRQHLVGADADYILANPNGVTCDGCSFDPNFNKVTLGAGNVIMVDDGKYGSLMTTSHKKIVIKNINDKDKIAKSLYLITPEIKIDSDLVAENDISIILGSNAVDINGDIIGDAKHHSNGYAIDGVLLGGMSANRIKIFDNKNQRKLTLSKNIVAGTSLNINSTGELNVAAEELVSSGELNIKASTVNMIAGNKSVGYEGVTLASPKIKIEADGDINLTNVSSRDAYGDLFIKGGAVAINSTNYEKKRNVTDYDDKKRTGGATETTVNVYNTYLQGKNISLEADSGDLSINAIKVKALEKLTLKSAKDIKMSGKEEAIISVNKIDYDGYDTDLKSGHDYSYTKHTDLETTQLLSDGDINIKSGRDIILSGTEVEAYKELSIQAKNNIDISAQKTKHEKIINKHYQQGLGFGGAEENRVIADYDMIHKSKVSGGEVNIAGQGNVAINSSEINSRGQMDISGDRVVFSGTLNEINLYDKKASTAIFGIDIDSSKKNNHYERFIDSKVDAKGIFKINAGSVVIDGSLFNIEDNFNIKSRAGVSITAAMQQQKIDEEKTRLSFDFYTKEISKGQYNAGFMIKHAKETEVSLKKERNVATINAEWITIESGDGNLELYGTTLNSTKGDISLRSLHDIGVFAARNSAISDKTKTVSSGGAYYTGGVNKAGNGVSFNHDDEKSHLATDTGIVSRLNSAGNISLYALGDITQQGSQHVAGGEYSAKGNNINQLASNNSSIGRTTQKHASGGVGFNIDYSGIIRPFKKAIENNVDENGLVLPNLKAPNLGVDINGKGHKIKKSAESVVAFVTSIYAKGKIKVTGDTVIDEGTQYKSGESINITATDYFNKSAVNSDKGDEKKESAQGGVRVATSTGKDIKISVKGEGGVSISDFYTQESLPSVLQSMSGVNIQTANNGYLQATQIDGGTGDVVATAGNKLYFDHATSSGDKNISEVYGKGGLKIGLKADSTGVDAEGAGHQQQGTSFYNNAIKGSINTRGNVNLSADNGDLILVGTQLGKQDAPVDDVELNAGGQIRLLASVSDSATREDKAGGSAVLGISRSSSADSTTTGGAFGFTALKKRVNESTLFSQGAAIYSNGEVAMRAKSDDNEAIYAQGLQLNTWKLNMNAVNGGVLLESAQSQAPKDNIDFFISASASGSKTSASNTGSSAEHKLTGGSFNINNDKDKQWIIKHQNSQITGKSVVLESKKDMQLKGARITSDMVQLDAGGDLNIQSVKEFEQIDKNSLKFNLSYMGSTDLVGDEMVELGGSGSSTSTDKQGVTEASGIFGKDGVTINHKGKKTVIGAELVNENKPVEWNTFKEYVYLPGAIKTN